MPLTEKGEKIFNNMSETYGKEKGEEVFYASKNAGKITGVDDDAEVFRDQASGQFTKGAGYKGVHPREDAESPALETRKAGQEEKRQRKGEREGEQGEADLPQQLEDAEAELKALEREQDQIEQGQERKNAIDDTKEQIRALRDQIKTQARQALGKPDDALTDLERKQDGNLLIKHISDACDVLARRMDNFERQAQVR